MSKTLTDKEIVAARMNAPTLKSRIFWIATLVVIPAIVFAIFFSYARSYARSAADIEEMTQSIKGEFAKQDGVTVTKVFVSHGADGNMTGFVKLHTDTVLGAVDTTMMCNSTPVEGGTFIWRCAP